jgi:hypothetical protein
LLTFHVEPPNSCGDSRHRLSRNGEAERAHLDGLSKSQNPWYINGSNKPTTPFFIVHHRPAFPTSGVRALLKRGWYANSRIVSASSCHLLQPLDRPCGVHGA